MSQIIRRIKEPDEKIHYGVDFTEAIAITDTITGTGAITVYDPAGADVTSTMLVSGSKQISGNVLSGLFQGGSDGNQYRICFEMTTTRGEVLKEEVYLSVSTLGLPPTANTLEKLKMRLREEIGSPSTTDYSDTQCGNDVISAIKQYSKYKPDEVFDALTSVVNQSVYDLSGKDRIMNVTMVFYSINLEWEFDRYWPMSIDIGRLAGISLFENPSIWTQYVSRLKEYKSIFERSFEFNRTIKSLRLIPQPIHQRQVPYIYTRRHTAETIPEEDIDDMLLWAKWMAKQALAAKARRSKEITQVSGYGISATISLGANDLMKEAKEHKDDFERRFGALSSIMMVG